MHISSFSTFFELGPVQNSSGNEALLTFWSCVPEKPLLKVYGVLEMRWKPSDWNFQSSSKEILIHLRLTDPAMKWREKLHEIARIVNLDYSKIVILKEPIWILVFLSLVDMFCFYTIKLRATAKCKNDLWVDKINCFDSQLELVLQF